MSTIVNGHREDESSAHTRPHGHILPMLSFSASTPTEEDNPLDSTLAIDVTLWEQPEDVVEVSDHSGRDDEDTDHGGRNPETVPLIDVSSSRDVVIIDGPDGDDDDEPDETAPLLAGGSRGGGSMTGGGGGCSDDGDSGVGGLGIPVNMPRSPEEPEDKLVNGGQTTSVGELRDVASQLVCEVISQAQAQATKTNDKVEENQRIADPHSDEQLMEVVRRFVSDIMAAAKAEAWDSMRQIQNNNNNVLSLKEEAAAAAAAAEGGGGEGSVKGRGPGNLASPTSTHGAERFFRGGPWYVQMGRVFSTFVSRICPCRCPTKP